MSEDPWRLVQLVGLIAALILSFVAMATGVVGAALALLTYGEIVDAPIWVIILVSVAFLVFKFCLDRLRRLRSEGK